jgi:hypothetical protein
MQGNQFSGDFEVDEADIEKHPTGVFFREGGEKGGLLSFSIAKRKKNAPAKRDFAPCGFSSAKLRSAELNWRPVALSSSAAQPWTPATFGKAAKAFDTGLVCDCLGFVSAPEVFYFFFAMIHAANEKGWTGFSCPALILLELNIKEIN